MSPDDIPLLRPAFGFGSARAPNTENTPKEKVIALALSCLQSIDNSTATSAQHRADLEKDYLLSQSPCLSFKRRYGNNANLQGLQNSAEILSAIEVDPRYIEKIADLHTKGITAKLAHAQFRNCEQGNAYIVLKFDFAGNNNAADVAPFRAAPTQNAVEIPPPA
jgi:hypothetical protein